MVGSMGGKTRKKKSSGTAKFDTELAERVRVAVGPRPDLVERKMFGGLAFMIGGNMACGIAKNELMVRVEKETWEDILALPHARPMDFTGRPMRGMVYVDRAGIASDEDLRTWVARGVDYAASLPPK